MVKLYAKDGRKEYRLDLYWNDVYMSDFDVLGDDPEMIYKEYSNGLLKVGLQQGWSLPKQKEWCIRYCNEMVKKKKDCYKIKSTEHFMFLSAFFALHKMNYEPTYNNFIFLKKKKIKKKKSISTNKTHR